MKLVVEGMTCDHCVRAITNVLLGLDPAARVAIDLSAGEVRVSNGTFDAAAAAKVIGDEGYAVVAMLEDDGALAGGAGAPAQAPRCCGTCQA